MRIILCVIGSFFGAAALALAALRCFPAARMLALWAAVLLVGLLIERWRYKKLAAGRRARTGKGPTSVSSTRRPASSSRSISTPQPASAATSRREPGRSCGRAALRAV